MSDITVVTAFFDIGRGNLPLTYRGRALPPHQFRSVDTYFEYFEYLAKLKNNMVIYTTSNFAQRVHEIRQKNGLQDKTKVVICDNYLPENFVPLKEKIEEVMNDPKYYEKVTNPQLIEYWHSDYVLVNILKSFYVDHAIQKGLIDTDLVAWIDFGYCRNEKTLTEPYEWNYDFDAEKIHLFNMRPIEKERPIDEIIYTGDVYIQGCHIVAGIKMWDKLRGTVSQSLNILLNHNLIDDDQTLLLMSYMMDTENYELHFVDPSDWFVAFRKFNNAQHNLPAV